MSDKVCESFKWIGQSFKYCDDCGQPFWEHSHVMRVRNARLFNQIIPAADKAACKAKWDRS